VAQKQAIAAKTFAADASPGDVAREAGIDRFDTGPISQTLQAGVVPTR
jgi:hypothetical protein